MKMRLPVLCLVLVNSLLMSIDPSYYKLVNPHQTMSMLKSMIREGDLVFDVGAHKGNKAKLYLDCGAQVVCFEPQPGCVAILENRYKTESRLTIDPIGLGSHDDILQLYQPHQAPSSVFATFSPDWIKDGRFSNLNWKKTIEVPVTTLDKMISKYGTPRFCKIDVEDFEYEVLLGLHQPIDYVSFEFHDETMEKAKKCVNYLKELGYKHFNVAIATSDKFWFDEWVPAERFIEELAMIRNLDWRVIKKLWGDIYASFE